MIEALSFGKRPTDAAAIMAAASATTAPGGRGDVDTAASTAVVSPTIDSNDYSYLASGSRDRTVRLWDPLKGLCLMVFSAHENWVRAVVLHPSGKFIISSSDDKSIRVMDIKEGRCLRTIADAHSHFIPCIALSPSSPILVSGSVDKSLSVWACT